MYKKAFARRLKGNKFLIHLWEDQGYSKVEWDNQAYIECHEADAQFMGLNGEPLKKIKNYNQKILCILVLRIINMIIFVKS